jgi:hypothetical protein
LRQRLAGEDGDLIRAVTGVRRINPRVSSGADRGGHRRRHNWRGPLAPIVPKRRDIRRDAQQNLIAAMVANGLSIFLMHRASGLRSHRSVKSFLADPGSSDRADCVSVRPFYATDLMMGE